jgi:hypothetical protein
VVTNSGNLAFELPDLCSQLQLVRVYCKPETKHAATLLNADSGKQPAIDQVIASGTESSLV